MADMIDTRGATVAPPSVITPIIRALMGLTRDEVDLLIEQAIDYVDTLDGDPDLEEDNEDCCPAGDDGIFAGSIRDGGSSHGIGDDADAEDDDPAGDDILDSPEQDRDETFKIAPIYGEDQSRGPANYRAVQALHDHEVQTAADCRDTRWRRRHAALSRLARKSA